MNDLLDTLMKCRLEILRQDKGSGADNGADAAGLAFRLEAQAAGRLLLRELEGIENETRLRSVFGSSIRRLIQLCDELYEHSGDENDANVVVVMEVMGEVKRSFAGLVDRSLALPRAFRAIHSGLFRAKWEQLLSGWKDYGFDEELLAMAQLPLQLFEMVSVKLSWFHYTWMRNYLSQLEQLDFSSHAPYPSPEHLIRELLIRLNFNHDRFAGHCFRVIEAAVNKRSEQEDQLYVLGMTAKVVAQLNGRADMPFVEDSPAVSGTILNWIRQEQEFREKYDPDFFRATGEKAPVNPWKFHYHKFNGEQVSFWHKMQMDHDLLPIEPIETFAKRISYNCSTGSKEHVAYTTFLAKLYSKDIDVVAPIYELVESIIRFLEPILQKLLGMKTELEPFVKYRG